MICQLFNPQLQRLFTVLWVLNTHTHTHMHAVETRLRESSPVRLHVTSHGERPVEVSDTF